MKPRRVAPLVLLAMMIAQGASALCTPYPLRLLVKKSDIIVVAEVQEMRQWFEDSHGREVDLPRQDTDHAERGREAEPLSSVLKEGVRPEDLELYMERGMAVLSVSSVLKGDAPDTVTVRYEPSIVCCPPQPEYREGRRVLAFLNKCKREDAYVTCCDAYGAKFVSGEELRVYESRIRQMFDLLEVRNRQERQAAIADWLVACAEDPITRWDGLYDLSEGAESSPSPKPCRFWQRKEPLFPAFHTFLTESHRRRLLAVLKALTLGDELEFYEAQMLITILAACDPSEALAALEERYQESQFRRALDDEGVPAEQREMVAEFVAAYEAGRSSP